MSSQDVIKSTAKKLKYYMEVKRLEDAFDLSGPDKPQRHYPTLKPRPTLLYDGLHDRALKHYFRNPEVKKHLAQIKPKTSQSERETKVRRDVDRYMEKSHFASPYTNLVRAKPSPKKRRSNFQGGPLLLRSRHGPQLSRGETERLVNVATKLLVATETIPIDQKRNGRRHSGKNFRADSGVGSSLPMIDNGYEDYGQRPERPKSTYGHRPTRPKGPARPKSALEARPKSAAKSSPSTARYGYDSLGRRIKLHLEQPRHYEASESDQDPDDYDDNDFDDSRDNGMNILVPVTGSGKNQSPEWLNIQMSKVNMNDRDDYEEVDEEEEEEEEEENDEEQDGGIIQGDEMLHSIDNTTQTGREMSCQTVENQDNTKVTQTRRANTEESMTDPYQADMGIQTAPPPVTLGTQTVVPPPEVSTQTVPPSPTTGTQTYPEVYCQTTPITNMETQTEVHRPAVACQVEPPLDIGVQVTLPPPTPTPPPEPEPEPEEDYESLKHGPRLKAGKRTVYELSIHTGNRLGASTRADVHVLLYGEKGNTGKIKLKQSKNTKDGKKVKFQKGQIDVFKVESYYVGKIECICIGHDKQELGCGWFLEKVLIREYYDDVTYEFLCERWLSAQDEDGQTVRTIPVTNIIMDESSDHSDYVEKSPDSSTYTDTDLRLHQVTSLDGHFVRTDSQPKTPPSHHGNHSDHSDAGSHSRKRTKYKKSSKKVGKAKGKSRRKPRMPVTNTDTDTDTDADSDSERTSRSNSDSAEDDDGSDSGGSGSSGSGSTSGSGSSSSSGSGSGSSSGSNSSGSNSSSDDRKADGESKSGSVGSGRYRDRSGKEPKEENAVHFPKENADAASPKKDNRTASNDDDSSPEDDDDDNGRSSHGSVSQPDRVSKKSVPIDDTDTRDLPKSTNSTKPADKDSSEYMNGFKAALKMKEHRHEQEETARLADEERRRQKEEFLLNGPSIHQSCKKGDLDRVRKLIQHNAELINTPDERGWTPLHIASANGQVALVKYLAANDINITNLTPTGYTAMHMATMNGHVAVVKVLSAMGMTVDCRTVDEQTPLHMAAMSGHLECTKWLVANNAHLDVIDNMGRTATDLAEEYRHDEVVTFLRSCQRELKRQDSSLAMLRSRMANSHLKMKLMVLQQNTNKNRNMKSWRGRNLSRTNRST